MGFPRESRDPREFPKNVILYREGPGADETGAGAAEIGPGSDQKRSRIALRLAPAQIKHCLQWSPHVCNPGNPQRRETLDTKRARKAASCRKIEREMQAYMSTHPFLCKKILFSFPFDTKYTYWMCNYCCCYYESSDGTSPMDKIQPIARNDKNKNGTIDIFYRAHDIYRPIAQHYV